MFDHRDAVNHLEATDDAGLHEFCPARGDDVENRAIGRQFGGVHRRRSNGGSRGRRRRRQSAICAERGSEADLARIEHVYREMDAAGIDSRALTPVIRRGLRFRQIKRVSCGLRLS